MITVSGGIARSHVISDRVLHAPFEFLATADHEAKLRAIIVEERNATP